MSVSPDATRALRLVLASALLAGLALGVALWLTRPSDDAAKSGERLSSSTPERAAESFIEALRSGAVERAAHFATPELARNLRVQEQPAAAPERESFIVHESHRLEGQRLRLTGVLVQDGQAEADGKSVSLTLHKQSGRYLVEEITW